MNTAVNPAVNPAVNKKGTPNHIETSTTEKVPIVLLHSTVDGIHGVNTLILRLLHHIPHSQLVLVWDEGKERAEQVAPGKKVTALCQPRTGKSQGLLVQSLRSARHLASLPWLRSRLRSVIPHNATVVVCNLRTPITTFLAAGLPNRKIGWIHSNVRTSHDGIHSRLSARVYGLFDRIVTCSNECRDDFANAFPRVASKSLAIFNGIDREEIQQRAAQRLAARPPFILFVGSLTYRKGADVLLESFAQLVAEGASQNLVLAGDGPERSALENQTRALGLEQRVSFVGNQDNVFKWMRRSQAVIVPSRSEGLPMVLIEAMACGTPVVAADCKSGPREVLSGGEFGMLFPVDDIAALASNLAILLGDEELRQRYVRLGLQRSRDFSIETMARQFVEISQEPSAKTAHPAGEPRGLLPDLRKPA